MTRSSGNAKIKGKKGDLKERAERFKRGSQGVQGVWKSIKLQLHTAAYIFIHKHTVC